MRITRATSTPGEADATADATSAPGRSLATPFGVDETAEHVLDLLGHAALVRPR